MKRKRDSFLNQAKIYEPLLKSQKKNRVTLFHFTFFSMFFNHTTYFNGIHGDCFFFLNFFELSETYFLRKFMKKNMIYGM